MYLPRVLLLVWFILNLKYFLVEISGCGELNACGEVVFIGEEADDDTVGFGYTVEGTGVGDDSALADEAGGAVDLSDAAGEGEDGSPAGGGVEELELVRG